MEARLPLRILWFDSLGAKSSSILLEGTDCDVLVDPGAAAMQPSYPLPEEEKARLRRRALEEIRSALLRSRTRVIVVTHYHYDHHPRPGDPILPASLFRGKTIIAKSPNTYINESQWKRARLFYEALAPSPNNLYTEPGSFECEDPVSSLSIASSKSFGDYDSRRRELLAKGREWFRRLCKLWSNSRWIRGGELGDNTTVLWSDGGEFHVCGVELKFTPPWFHGVEYDRTGWVTGFEAHVRGFRVFYTSDVMGPIIEDYAEYIARRKPDIVVLDGPPTYLYPYMLNKVNLQRAIENAVTIVSASPRLVIYDHHLLREKRWRERVREVFVEAEKNDVTLATAAELQGEKPLIDML
jgi:hypothetical protein